MPVIKNDGCVDILVIEKCAYHTTLTGCHLSHRVVEMGNESNPFVKIFLGLVIGEGCVTNRDNYSTRNKHIKLLLSKALWSDGYNFYYIFSFIYYLFQLLVGRFSNHIKRMRSPLIRIKKRSL
jgi:hypothetical protein